MDSQMQISTTRSSLAPFPLHYFEIVPLLETLGAFPPLPKVVTAANESCKTSLEHHPCPISPPFFTSSFWKKVFKKRVRERVFRFFYDDYSFYIGFAIILFYKGVVMNHAIWRKLVKHMAHYPWLYGSFARTLAYNAKTMLKKWVLGRVIKQIFNRFNINFQCM